MHQRGASTHVNCHAERFLDFRAARTQLHKCLAVKAYAAITVSGNTNRKRDKFLTCPALFVPSELIEIGLERSLEMRKKRPTPEQIVTLLRQIEVATSQGKSIAIACREAGISDQSYYRWRKEYGGLDLDQARRMKDLEKENSRLKRLVADLSLEKQVLKDIASGNL